MNKKFSLTRDYTEAMKGVAILLMLFHHFFGFPNWYVEGVSYIGIPLRVNTLEYILGQFGHICVAIFAFLTGYGMFFSYKSGGIFKKSCRRLMAFLTGYWLILFGVAIPINFAVGRADITPMLILKNMFAYDCSLVPFAWYVRFYIAIVITLPIFNKLMNRYAILTIPMFLFIPAGINYCLGMVPGTNGFVIKSVYYTMEYFLWLPCVLMGLCFAKYSLFEKLGALFARLKRAEIFVCLGAVLVLMYLRAYKSDTIGVIFSFDSFYAPIFVFLACRIISVLPDFLGQFLKFMGKHSMNIWFLHSMFFFNSAQLMKVAYAPRISVLILAWVILLCLPISSALTAVSKVILLKGKDIKKGKEPQKDEEKTGELAESGVR